ncbi:hypothetical protein [Janthinobacterium violaceinigrum]|nr:hypothetical protein [Janthinobacterium violaceinigrum]
MIPLFAHQLAQQLKVGRRIIDNQNGGYTPLGMPHTAWTHCFRPSRMYSAMPAVAALSALPKPCMPWPPRMAAGRVAAGVWPWPQTADRERMYTCSQRLTGFKSDTALKSYRFANFLGEKSLPSEAMKYYFYATFKNKYTKLLS